MTAPKPRFLIVATLVLLVINVSVVIAQTQVRVVRDGTTIWRPDVAIAVTTVKAGTILDVVRSDTDWYFVLIPPEYGGRGEVGRIAAPAVTVLAGGTTVPRPAPTPPAPAPTRPPERPTPTQPANRPRAPGPQANRTARTTTTEVFGFGDVGYGSWLAHDTFKAVLGSSQAPMFGGGVQVRFRSLFVEGSIERFQRTGARVFVYGGDVFNLGIADTVRIIPITATVGYRHAGKRVTPYVGGGIGTYLYKETSDFADPSENPSEHFTSYHVLGGVEFVNRSPVRVGLEVQYITVPNALGTSGASAAFNEKNLGGTQVRLKVLVGK
jgi:opacity protein-like surface antigen